MKKWMLTVRETIEGVLDFLVTINQNSEADI